MADFCHGLRECLKEKELYTDFVDHESGVLQRMDSGLGPTTGSHIIVILIGELPKEQELCEYLLLRLTSEAKVTLVDCSGSGVTVVYIAGVGIFYLRMQVSAKIRGMAMEKGSLHSTS